MSLDRGEGGIGRHLWKRKMQKFIGRKKAICMNNNGIAWHFAVNYDV